MNTFIWIIQGILAFIFLFAGLNKIYYREDDLVKQGQVGLEGLSDWLIKFIGISEVLGAFGLIIPMTIDIFPGLTELASIGLGIIMILAAFVHLKRKEFKMIVLNVSILAGCFLVAYFRTYYYILHNI